MKKGDLRKAAEVLAAAGRFGDTVLMHISPMEKLLLDLAWGEATLNPETGLPEHWSFGNFAQAINPVGNFLANAAGDSPIGDYLITADPGLAMSRNTAMASNEGNWGNPYDSGQAQGWDYLGGGPAAESPENRRTGRTVGTAAALWGMGSAAGFSGGGGGGSPALAFNPDSGGGFIGEDIYAGTPAGNTPAAGGFSLPGSDLPRGSSNDGTTDQQDFLEPGIFSPGSNIFNPAGSSPPGSRSTQGPWTEGLNLGSGAYGMWQSLQMRRLARRAFERQDPFGPQRAQYQREMAALSANPSSITSRPGYQFGFDEGNRAVARRMAAAGYSGSGNEQIALQRYGQEYAGKFYGDEMTRLAKLSGADIGPGYAGTNLISGNIAAFDAASRALATLSNYTRRRELERIPPPPQVPSGGGGGSPVGYDWQ